MTGLYDSFNRPISYLRISVTDRCNLRCIFCMPKGGSVWVRHEDILTFKEIRVVVQVAAELGLTVLIYFSAAHLLPEAQGYEASHSFWAFSTGLALALFIALTKIIS